jgi:hypothetical protein
MTRLIRAVLFLVALSLLLPAVASAQWETPSRAFHKAPVFPLEGRHMDVPCASCHIKGQVRGTPTTCADCHWIRRQDDKYRARLGMACEQCHRPTSWTATKWDHGSATGMQLNAAHKTLSCDTCHKNSLFTGVNLTCGTCHAKDYAAAKTPDHKAAGFPTTCELCHRPADATFTQGRFDHNASFQLVGMHATVDCVSCHRSGVYKGTPRDCVGCHRPDFERTTQPNHATAGFSTECATCHRPTDPTFGTGNFNHNTVFQLVGLHATATCVNCHTGGTYKGTARDCVGCHRTDYQRTTTPNHAAAGFSTACESCHRPTDTSWGGSGTFNHNSVFQLVGTHTTQACATCHVNGVFKGTPRDCVGCHRDDYQKTTAPNHAASGFSTTCESCHKATDSSWRGGGTFNHNSVFQLVGTHTTQACATCHVNNVFKGTPRDCVGCHRDDYQKTTAPNHAASGFSTTCESCHKATDSSWRGAGTFNHASVFQLVGTHATQACATCHVNNVFKGTPRTCTGCHLDEYQRTVAPNHAASGFSTTCETCHRATDTSWRSGGFNHNTVFQLLGKHATAVCGVCHVNNVYRGTARDCVGCHRNEYDRTASPSHVAARFPTTCEVCHLAADAAWTQGRFTHTWFPITSGKHSGNPCSACHTNPANYTQFTCLTCHGRTKMDDEHRNRAGYAYDSNRCYACHPNGRGD